MKKIIAIALIVCMLSVFSGCSEGESSADESSGTISIAESSTENSSKKESSRSLMIFLFTAAASLKILYVPLRKGRLPGKKLSV